MIDLPGHHGGDCQGCEDACGRRPYACDAEHSDDDDTCPECPTCDFCEGSGEAYWEWDDDDTGDCDVCKAQDVPTQGYGEDGEAGRVCLPCYLKWHATQCGCGAWPLEVTL